MLPATASRDSVHGNTRVHITLLVNVQSKEGTGDFHPPCLKVFLNVIFIRESVQLMFDFTTQCSKCFCVIPRITTKLPLSSLSSFNFCSLFGIQLSSYGIPDILRR